MVGQKENMSVTWEIWSKQTQKVWSNYILPRNPGEIPFEETLNSEKIFGEKSSLFNSRWQCLNPRNKGWEDYSTFAGIVNRECERFKLKELTPLCLNAWFLIFVRR